MKIVHPYTLVFVLLAATWPVAYAVADLAAPLPGRIVNRTGACDTSKPLSVQLLGSDVSPRVDLPVDGDVSVSLPKGLYGLTALGSDGAVVEESRVLVSVPGFVVPVGCPAQAVAMAPSDAALVLISIQLFNSSMDCGRPETVEFIADGLPLGRVEPGARVLANAPRGATRIEVFAQGRRTMAWTRPPLEAGQALTYGCTFPAAQGPASGIAVAFENTTDSCTDPAQHRFLTLWVDGEPAVGLAPGQRGGVRVVPGPHVFQVFVGQTLERVVKGTKDVKEPFRIHFGCGR